MGCCARAPGFETGTVDPERGPTLGQLSAAYDPALVALLVPGMVVPDRREGADR